jgi:DNA polymerase-3 subunit beta
MPILANILLSTEQGRLKISATNLEIGINCLVDATVITEGSTTVPAKTFLELVNNLRQGQVELTVIEDSHDIQIKSPGNNTNIKGMDPSEYPNIPTAESGEEPILLEAGQLKEIIPQVVFAAADDDARPVLTGVLVEVANEQISFAAADAFRVALRVSPLPGHTASHGNILVPAKTLSELARILPPTGDVQMIVTPNRSQVLFHTDQIDLVSRLIEGTFPNIHAAIPKDYTTRVVLDAKEFATSVKTVTPFARDSSNIARVELKNATDEDAAQCAGSLTLEATAEAVGSNVSTMNAAIDGPDTEIIFNVKYLTDVLAIMEGELTLDLTTASRPGVFHKGQDYTYVIMPMSTNR